LPPLILSISNTQAFPETPRVQCSVAHNNISIVVITMREQVIYTSSNAVHVYIMDYDNAKSFKLTNVETMNSQQQYSN
jgi:hypothetical protein